MDELSVVTIVFNFILEKPLSKFLNNKILKYR